MKVYRAETGQQLDWHSQSNIITNLLDLQLELEHCAGVPVDNQILLTSFGTPVKQENLTEVLESTGKDEYIVFCYDRQYLDAIPEEIAILLDVETPSLEPPIPSFDVTSLLEQIKKSTNKQSLSEACHTRLGWFRNFETYYIPLIDAASIHTALAEAVVKEQRSQRMALNVAMANLEKHRKWTDASVKEFEKKAGSELVRQTNLLYSIGSDLSILNSVRIHSSMHRILDSVHESKTHLSDFIDQAHIESVRQDTMDLRDFLSTELKDLQDLITSIKYGEQQIQTHAVENINLHTLDATLSDIQALLVKAQVLRDRTRRDLKMVFERAAKLLDKPLSAVFASLNIEDPTDYSESASASSSTRPKIVNAREHLDAIASMAECHVTEYLPKLSKYERQIRHLANELINSKRDSINDFIYSMKDVSYLQGNIADIKSRVPQAMSRLNEFKEKYSKEGSKDLESVRNIIFAYGKLMIEMVRRKEYSKLLTSNSELIADSLAKYRKDEEDRRSFFRQKVASSLPFKLTIMESASPQCEISVNGTNQSNQITLEKRDIDEFISLLGQVYSQLPVHRSMSDSKRSSLTNTQSNSKRLSVSTMKNNSSNSSSKKIIKRLTGTYNNQGEHPMNLINSMKQEVDNLKFDFLKMLEESFFTSNGIMIDQAKIREIASERDDISVRTGALSVANDSEGHATTRSAATRQQQLFNDYNKRIGGNKKIPSHNAVSPSSSTFSVIENDKKNEALAKAEMKQLKTKLNDAQEDVTLLEQKNQEQLDEISDQAEEIKQLKERLDMLENEKEDFAAQVQGLERIVDTERQTYEQKTQSFINELKNKDKSADFRIASAEEVFQSKIIDLQYELEEEQRMKKNLEIEHASELNTIQSEHAAEIEKLNQLVLEERQNVKDLENEKSEMVLRNEQLGNNLANVRRRLDEERLEHEQEITLKDEKMDQIKLFQQEAHARLGRVQTDWESKNNELAQQVEENRRIREAIYALFCRFRNNDETSIQNMDVLDGIRLFKEHLEGVESQFNMMTQELDQVSETNGALSEQHSEWRMLASNMAGKLEEFRRNVVLEIVTHLQLPLEETGLNALSKRIEPSNDDTATWSEILRLISSINTQKFVMSIHKRVKDNQEQARKYKKEYHYIKDKYNKLCTTYCEKIAFRNFKIGDVALFLPTRNSTGKPWAAFNISAPHYFLRSTENTTSQMQTREWIVARITAITEYTTDENDPESNPYGLDNNLTYYMLDVESWRHNKHHPSSSSGGSGSSRKRQLQQTDSGLASIGALPSKEDNNNEGGNGNSSSTATSPTNNDSDQQQLIFNRQQKRPSLISNINHSSSSLNVVHSYNTPHHYNQQQQQQQPQQQ